MWLIVSLVIGAAAFGGNPRIFTSQKHFTTIEACTSYLATDEEELRDELSQYGVSMPYEIKQRCVEDPRIGTGA